METVVISQITAKDIQDAVRVVMNELLDDRAIGPPPTADEIGGIEMAMDVTGDAKATIYSKVSKRQIPHMKRGKKLYFSRAELIAWLGEGRRATRSEIIGGENNPDSSR